MEQEDKYAKFKTKEYQKDKNHKYYEKHKEEVKARNKEWMQNNQDKYKESVRQASLRYYYKKKAERESAEATV